MGGGEPLAAWGKLALVMVQVLPTPLSVQAVIAVLPAESLEISAPLMAFAPAGSEATTISTSSKLSRGALAAEAA